MKNALIAVVVVIGAAVVLATWPGSVRAQEPAVVIPAPAFDPAPSAPGPAKAVLAGGCFWGVQGVFEHVKGVSLVFAGYAGGTKPNPTYDEVSSETTGYAESVEITYDPAVVSYGKLLQVFFSVAHNPTELNRQGPDTGTSYRSDIFYVTDLQKQVAEAYIAQLTKANVFKRPIVTRVDPYTAFYHAEDYHQDFLVHNPSYPYIVINDLPKIGNFKRLLPDLYNNRAVLTTDAKRRG